MSAQCSALRQNITYDVGLESVQAIMTSVHDFDGLRRSIVVLQDQWHRFLHRTRILEPSLRAAVSICACFWSGPVVPGILVKCLQHFAFNRERAR